jgi:hypothetical protein
MDRPDDKHDEITNDTDETPAGSVLGLSGAPVPKVPGDPSASNDPGSVARRRERALGQDEDEPPRRDDPYKPGKGATGIDMGAGGRGTDIEPGS